MTQLIKRENASWSCDDCRLQQAARGVADLTVGGVIVATAAANVDVPVPPESAAARPRAKKGDKKRNNAAATIETASDTLRGTAAPTDNTDSDAVTQQQFARVCVVSNALARAALQLVRAGERFDALDDARRVLLAQWHRTFARRGAAQR
jgi:hypothetical protein